MKISIKSRTIIDAEPKQVWIILCNAEMQSAPWWFRLGIPAPRQCVIVKENNGIVTERQCRTSKGAVNQKITEWHPPYRLSFVPVSDDIGLEKNLKSMKDTFLLKQISNKTQLVRVTQIEVKGMLCSIKGIFLKWIIKQIHVFVMRNFKRIAENYR